MPNDSPPSRVLAAVLNWCRETDSAACVRSLMQSDFPALDILICDNASPDGSGERLHAKFPEHEYLQTGTNSGYAGGNAIAAQWALDRGYEYLLVVNDDAEVRPSCVGKLVAALNANVSAAAASPTVLFHGSNRVWFGGGEFVKIKAMGVHRRTPEPFHESSRGSVHDPMEASNPGQPRQPAGVTENVERVTFLSGCVLMLRCSVLREYGAFRAEFFAYVEDAELSLRFVRKGWDLLYVPAAVASHKVRYPPPADSSIAIRLRDINRRRLVSLHYTPAEKAAFAAWYYPTRVAHLLRYAITADSQRTKAIWAGMFTSIRPK